MYANFSYCSLMILVFFFSADPLVGSIATQYTQNREEHDRIAKLWCQHHKNLFSSSLTSDLKS